MKVSGNTILITGGTSGIGFELAKQLIALGNTVLITGRDAKKLESVKLKLPTVTTYQSDVTDTAAIGALFKRIVGDHPKLNMLVNNAGIMRTINLHEATDLEGVTNEIETNLSGPIRMTAQFISHLKTQPNAAIVNVSSGLAFVPLPTSPVYCATKAGLHSFSQSLRIQLANSSVKVFELAPPATQTELIAQFAKEDTKGVSIMKVEKLVEAAIDGLREDLFEICPGQSQQLKMMSRIAPGFILKMMSRNVPKMIARSDA